LRLAERTVALPLSAAAAEETKTGTAIINAAIKIERSCFAASPAELQKELLALRAKAR
jgi:hypothetical protein